MSYVGKTFKNNKGLTFTILSKEGKYCDIIFDETGSKRRANIDNIKKGKVKDYFSKSVLNVACIGEPDRSKPYYKPCHQLWNNMIARCYSDDDRRKGYKWKGVEVCDRWLVFANFLEDIELIPDFDKWLVGDPKMNLDKDLIKPNSKVYSPSTCTFVEESLNKSLGARTKLDGYKRTLLS